MERPDEGRTPDLRASDADRERVAEVLREAFAEGRLTFAEHAERLEQTFASKTLGELAPLTRDLPSSRPGTSVPAPVSRPAADPGPPLTPIVALFSEDKRRGSFAMPEQLPVLAGFGSVTLDLTDAVVCHPRVTIVANAIFGSIDVIVPEGVEVRLEGFSIFGSRSVGRREGFQPGAPVLRIEGVALFGSVQVRSPRPRDRRRKRG